MCRSDENNNALGGSVMDLSQQSKILSLQQKTKETFNNDVLNILSGQGMYDVFENNEVMVNGDFVPFNEAMCFGQTTDQIFTDRFIKVRAKTHQTTINEYHHIVINPLKPLFNHTYKCIILWFGADMFCQMNLLTILGYLKQINYREKILFNLVNEHTYEVEEVEIHPANSQEIYQQVLLKQSLPAIEMMPVLNEGIKLYIHYQQADNEIIRYIKSHNHLPEAQLVNELFMMFPQYGLGDLQYLEMITKVKNH